MSITSRLWLRSAYLCFCLPVCLSPHQLESSFCFPVGMTLRQTSCLVLFSQGKRRGADPLPLCTYGKIVPEAKKTKPKLILQVPKSSTELTHVLLCSSLSLDPLCSLLRGTELGLCNEGKRAGSENVP